MQNVQMSFFTESFFLDQKPTGGFTQLSEVDADVLINNPNGKYRKHIHVWFRKESIHV